jgi:hypothetical protein
VAVVFSYDVQVSVSEDIVLFKLQKILLAMNPAKQRLFLQYDQKVKPLFLQTMAFP